MILYFYQKIYTLHISCIYTFILQFCIKTTIHRNMLWSIFSYYPFQRQESHICIIDQNMPYKYRGIA